MANAIYPKYKEQLLGATGAARDATSLITGTLKAALIDTGAYTYNAAHDFWNDAVAGVVGTPVALTTKTVVNGTLDADDVTFTAVSGATVEAIILYVDTAGADSTDPLVAYLDTGFTGLPVTPGGGNITVAWNASGILTI
jgi:hypothetical protein